MNHTQAPAHASARTRHNLLPGALQPGDQIQDHGRTRTISSIEANPGSPVLEAMLHFEDGDDGLGLAPGIRVTAWRATDH